MPGPMRFVAKGFRVLRYRLGLSASQMGKLLVVSEQSVYNWEPKVAIPRRVHLPAIAHLRGLGKREVTQLLGRKSRRRDSRGKHGDPIFAGPSIHPVPLHTRK
jgi:transcriptional regulator with XRE-family HTH domain